MKKKFFASLMAMVMVFGLAACGGSSDTTTTEGDAAEGGTGGKIGVSCLHSPCSVGTRTALT